MSSLSLPKVIHGKRSPADLERENFEKTQSTAITKAINSTESPVKEKHARSTILGTYQECGAGMFWGVVSKIPLQGNPITCWKFCHVLHKLLRDGHPNVVLDSLKFCSHLNDLGKLWGHLKDGYGKLISAYTKLLVQKLNFHKKNPRIPGTLMMSDETLSRICGSDVNSYFELACDMLDYMDEILTLQHLVFSSLDMSRSNSMTNTGQCRLAPLILCIQDSCQLYDYLVKSLFKLHSSLPPDTLSGHRDRFLVCYRKLKEFYHHSGNLQYFKNLVQVPVLPDEPPNFLIAADFSKHVKPVAVVPGESEPDVETPEVESTGFLIDTTQSEASDESDKFDQAFGDASLGNSFNFNGAPPPPPEPDERDMLIERLMREINQLREELERVKAEDFRIISMLKEKVEKLEEDIRRLMAERDEQKKEKEVLLVQVEAAKKNTAASAKLADVEKQVKASDEKFKKMKDIYTKLREEHVQLLRNHAEANKQLSSEKKAVEEKEQAVKKTEIELHKISEERKVIEATLQKSADDVTSQLAQVTGKSAELEKQKEELEERLRKLKEEQESLEKQLEQSQSQGQSLQQQLELTISEKKSTEEELNNKLSDLHRRVIEKCVAEGRIVIEDAVDQYENPTFSQATCTAEFLLTRAQPVLQKLKTLQESSDKYNNDTSSLDEYVQSITNFCHHLGDCVIHGIATSHSAQIEPGEELSSACKVAGEDGLKVLGSVEKNDTASLRTDINSLTSRVQRIIGLAEALVPKMEDVKVGEIGDMVDEEIDATTKAIEQAAARFEELMHSARAESSGLQLEVNERIIDSCTALMKAIRILVERSKNLQKEIVGQGRGTQSAKEFYKKNHRWTEGLISAAKAVGWGANALVEAADKVVKGEGKFEELMVCSNEIAASTAQLVVASKVKADRGSERLKQVSEASKGVSVATGNVVASAKTGAEMIEDQNLMDFTKLSLHQTKKLEMQTQVHVIELETLLEKERVKLGNLRKQHYQLAGESEGWEQDQAS
ncbi:huntingtin-interacting protein 1-like isoform X2 [Liolophura sinensis]|uniref:huntingtin-interacting protein 1-like isoform X2 n=1 Tax=Liolophura sinensis TaxID=3198878 RepID=UPI003158919B